MLESDPEAIPSTPPESVAKELRIVNTDSKETAERAESPEGRTRHPTARENSPEETVRRMRSLNERSARFRKILRATRETNPR